MPEKIKFKIVTPERVIYEEEIEQLTLTTKQGEITVLPNHIPLMSSLLAGELVVKKDGESISMAISGGFLEVRPGNEVVVLADTAERVEDIDEERAEEARQRAQKLIQEKQVDAKEFAALSAKIEKELARLKVKKKYQSRRPRVGPMIEE